MAVAEIYADVAVDGLPLADPVTLTYRVPDGLAAAGQVGQLVWVPLKTRWRLGVVVALVPRPALASIADILAVVEPELRLTERQLALAVWISERYRCGRFDALQPLLPPGAVRRAVVTWQRTALSADDESFHLTPTQRRLLELLDHRPALTLDVARRELPGRANLAAAMAALEASGLIARAAALVHRPPERRRVILVGLGNITAAKRPTPGQQRVLVLLQARSPALLPRQDLLRAAQVGESVVARLAHSGAVVIHRQVPPGATIAHVPAHAPAPSLTEGQTAAWQTLSQALEARRYAAFLLHGVTGSGKTELYLRAVATVLRRAQGAIVLAPEIALATQLVERVVDRFPDEVAVLHSSLDDTERYQQWQSIASGACRVVVGPRSALFAPLPEIGLIVLDEEHEQAYKQETPPRYHARAVADFLARQHGATLILGTATPDVITAYAADRGQVQRLVLPDRVTTAGRTDPLPMPDVTLVDMRRELRDDNTSLFSRLLQQRIGETLVSGSQSLLLLNRRGEATIVLCRDCGHVVKCGHCDVPLVYHRVGERLICHRCNARRTAPPRCPACGGPRIRHLGAGTQRVEAEVAKLWPAARVLRWDQDAVTARQTHGHLLRQVRNHEVDIVVGTQVIAKGLDLPKVMTVGVVAADTMLHLPDYRSAERTFQLLSQVAGRAGRAAPGGQVVLQSYTPEHYCLQAAAGHDYAAFYQEEIAFRRRFRYPPFVRLALFVYGHRDELVCQREAHALAEQLAESARRLLIADLDLLGPAPCFIRRLRGVYRWQIVARATSLSRLLKDIIVPPGWTLDVDPASLL